MTSPLTGLTGVGSYQQTIDENNQATPEERMGGVADPSHSKYLAEDFIRRGMQIGEPIGPYGPDNQLLSDESWFWESGGDASEDPLYDYTPSTHAGPWPKGIQSGPVGDIGPDATASKLRQLNALHGLDTNGDAFIQRTRGEALNDQWEEIDQLNPGDTLSEAPGSKQLMSSGFGWGTRDRKGSFARQNEYGFDSSHQHRRYATGSIPGNFLWMTPMGRPMMKTLPGPARPPIGPNSPFTGQDLGATFSYNGAVLQNVPTEYSAPPQPNLTAVPAADSNDSIVEWY